MIAAAPALRERAQAKTAVLTETLASALRDRGTSEPTASLAAQLGMAAFSHASAVWFRHPDRNLDRLLGDAFEDLHTLTAPLAAADEPGKHPGAAIPGASVSTPTGGPGPGRPHDIG